MIALMAVLIALTAAFTIAIQIPIGATGGYWNPSSIAITFSGLAFGPWVGGVAGGVGTAIADLATGYGQFAPISLLAHGLEGFLIGWLGRKRRTLPGMIFAWSMGSLAMILVYLLGGALLKGWPASFGEVPFNVFQAIVGGLVGIPLVMAVRRAYPQIDQMGQSRTWTEE